MAKLRLGEIEVEVRVWVIDLVVLDNADLGSSQDTSVQPEALALSVHDITVLLAFSLGHEGSLVHIGVELLGLAVFSRLAGIEPL